MFCWRPGYCHHRSEEESLPEHLHDVLLLTASSFNHISPSMTAQLTDCLVGLSLEELGIKGDRRRYRSSSLREAQSDGEAAVHLSAGTHLKHTLTHASSTHTLLHIYGTYLYSEISKN